MTFQPKRSRRDIAAACRWQDCRAANGSPEGTDLLFVARAPLCGHGRAAVGVTADNKICKIGEVELTHPMAMASSANLLRRRFRQRAQGGPSERDLRVERSGVIDPGDRNGSARVAQHSAAVPLILWARALKSPEAMRPKPRRRRASNAQNWPCTKMRVLGSSHRRVEQKPSVNTPESSAVSP